MSRKLIIAANWKMNKGPAEAKEFLSTFIEGIGTLADQADVLVAPNFLSIPAAVEAVAGTKVGVSSQNVSEQESGAFTGETSCKMLAEVGVQTVIIGHSERRSIYGETDAIINAKVTKSLAENMTVLFCIGETLEEREGGNLETVLRTQVTDGLKGIEDISNVVIAYEPVWAIGTGVTATAQQAQDTQKFVRSVVNDLYGADAAEAVRIQYGGSVKPANAKELLSQPDIDGALVGGASLDPNMFLELIANAVSE